MPIQTVSFRAPAEVIEALDALAAQKQVNRTALLNQAIIDYLAAPSETRKAKRVLGIMRKPALPEDFNTMASERIGSMFAGNNE